MNHLELGALESAMLKPTACERWLDQLEISIGHNLDGDQASDGYSLDWCVRMFEAGISIEKAGRMIDQSKRRARQSRLEREVAALDLGYDLEELDGGDA